MDIFNIGIQYAFAFFCYYAFLHVRCGSVPIKDGKLVFTEKETVVLHALATCDKSRKEVAFELGISMSDMSRTLTSARERNGFDTSDMMLRAYAIQLYKEGIDGL